MHEFKANVGNLMQHWTLCEILDVLKRRFKNLLYIDAYAMAPFSIRKPEGNATRRHFEKVRKHLPGQKSLYELLWLEAISQRKIEIGEVYPSSAVFVHNFWQRRLNRKLTLLLCEICPSKAEKIKTWLSDNQIDKNSLFTGDWRDRFCEFFLVGDSDVVFLSFDPNRYKCNSPEKEKKPKNIMDQGDISLLDIKHDLPMIVQLSTYATARLANQQRAVALDIKKKMAKIGFLDRCCVKANKQMMSLVYWRGVDLSRDLQCIDMRFREWLDVAKKYK